jgi:hypothetical protein
MKKLVPLLLVCILAGSANAGIIYGSIKTTDHRGRTVPLSGVTIRVLFEGREVAMGSTNMDGGYQLMVEPQGQCIMIIHCDTRLEYESHTRMKEQASEPGREIIFLRPLELEIDSYPEAKSYVIRVEAIPVVVEE